MKIFTISSALTLFIEHYYLDMLIHKIDALFTKKIVMFFVVA